jgi:formylglycine-generating enzyme required for sulfatase activity
VDAAEVNAFGVRGLHDLVWEWGAEPGSARAEGHAHHGAGPGHELTCASASIGSRDASNYPAFLRYAIRSGANGRTTLETLGFRCAA